MATMIKLRLPHPPTSFASVRAMPGLVGLALDEKFGVVCVSPQESLYVVRAESVNDLDRRRSLSPEIVDVYGDVRISTT